MFVRRFHWDDVASIAELIGELGYPVSPELMFLRMQRIDANPSYCTFVAEQNGQILGVLGVSQQLLYESNAVMAQINVLVTKSSSRGRGVGKALVHQAESWAKDQHAVGVYLTSGSRPERNHAHEFYRRQGYEVTGCRFVKTL